MYNFIHKNVNYYIKKLKNGLKLHFIKKCITKVKIRL